MADPCSFDGCTHTAARRKGGLCEGHARQRQRGQALRPLRHYGDRRQTLLEAVFALADTDSLDDAAYLRAVKRLFAAVRRYNVPRQSHDAEHDARRTA